MLHFPYFSDDFITAPLKRCQFIYAYYVLENIKEEITLVFLKLKKKKATRHRIKNGILIKQTKTHLPGLTVVCRKSQEPASNDR